MVPRSCCFSCTLRRLLPHSINTVPDRLSCDLSTTDIQEGLNLGTQLSQQPCHQTRDTCQIPYTQRVPHPPSPLFSADTFIRVNGAPRLYKSFLGSPTSPPVRFESKLFAESIFCQICHFARLSVTIVSLLRVARGQKKWCLDLGAMCASRTLTFRGPTGTQAATSVRTT
jgi:hypothetical protein